MKRKRLLPLAAAALACGVLIAAPQAASALAPDQAAPEVLGQANYYYYDGDGYISYDDTYGYIRLDQDELYLTIQPGSSSTSQCLKVLYVEDQSSRITWTSSNTAAAVVDANGNVTAVGDGQAVITATSAEGRCASCKVYTGSVGAQKKKKADSFFGLGGLFQKLFQKLFE